MKTKILLIPLMIFLLMGVVSAVDTIEVPAASSTLTGTVVFNTTTSTEQENVTFQLKCTNTNSTYVDIGTNVTSRGLNFSISYDTTAFQDDTGCTVNLLDENRSSLDTNTGLIVGNTNPTAATSLTSGDQGIDAEDTWTLTSTINSKNTQSCSLVDGGQGLWTDSLALTYSAADNTCSATFTGTPGGIYTYKVRTSDGTETTDSALSTVEIQGATGAPARSSASSPGLSGGNWGILALLGLGVWLLLGKK